MNEYINLKKSPNIKINYGFMIIFFLKMYFLKLKLLQKNKF